ncbi:TonB-dependent siderophore receptor [Aurantivibrio infirmus]
MGEKILINRTLRRMLFSGFCLGMLLKGAPVVAQENPVIDEIIVKGYVRDYRTDAAETAIGLGLRLKETPAAISVITQDLLQDQQVNNVDDALRNVSGVTKFKTGNGGEEKFSIRGFDASQSIYKDGARINNALNASNIPSTETANLQRIDVLKGPSALLYGQGEPGGIINYITKKPQVESYSGVEVIAGSEDFYKVEFDSTGALNSADTIAYRLVGAYEDSEGYRDEILRDRLMLNPSLAWIPSNNIKVTLGYEYLDDKYTQDRGQVLDGNNVDGYRYSGRLSEDQFFGIPNYNRKTTAESKRVYLLSEWSVTDFWQLELNYGKTENDKTNVDSSPRYIAGDLTVVGPIGSAVENLVSIQARQTIGGGDSEQISLKSIFDFTGPWNTEHKLLLSLSSEELSTEAENFRGDRNVFYNVVTREYFTDPMLAPGVIQATPNVTFNLNNRGVSRSGGIKEQGINLVDHIRFNEHFSVLLGARQAGSDNQGNGYEEDNLSIRAGVVYEFNQDLSTYLSYSEGYTSAANLLDVNGGSVDPEISESWELGLKWSLANDNLLVTATLYSVDLIDVPFVVNPGSTDPRFDNIGGIRSQGFEVEAVGYINENWRIQAGYAYIDNEISKGGIAEFNNIFTKGNRLPGIAENNFNLFTFYELPLGDGEFGLGGGVFYQGDVYISTENRSEYDAWTQVDLAAYYKQDAWKAQINIRNIFDKDYRLAQAITTTDSFAAVRVGTSSPLGITASVAYEF